MIELQRAFEQQVHTKYLGALFEVYGDDEGQRQVLDALKEATADQDNQSYRASVLRQFIRYLEKRGEAVGEELAEAYATELVELAGGAGLPNGSSLVTYRLADGQAVKIREERSVISRNGGTGHRTWEAALVLAEWLVKDQSGSGTKNGDNAKRQWLELGAGTGLAGAVAQVLHPQDRVVLTDGDDEVLEQLQANMELNGLPSEVRTLSWGVDRVAEALEPGVPTTVLAADVTYDDRLIPLLVGALAEGLAVPDTRAVVSATVRSDKTWSAFVDECDRKSITIELLHSRTASGPSDLFFFPPESPEVRIVELHY